MKRLLPILILITFLFLGCTKLTSITNNTNTNNTNTNTSNNKTENFLSNPKPQHTPLNLADNSISPTKFLPIGSLIFYVNNGDNNYLSTTDDKLNSTSLNPNLIVDTFNYSTEFLTTIGNYIYFSNTSENNNLYKLDYLKKTASKISNKSFNKLSSSNNKIFFINENSILSLYDIDKDEIKALTTDKCANYIINGEFILYKNLSDNSTLYSIKSDGSERTKLTYDSVDSFVPFNSNNIFYINSKDNNLYTFNTLLKQSSRVHILNGTDLKIYNNKLFYLDLSNSNHLHSIEVDDSFNKVQSTELTADMVNEYFPTSKGIFFTKAIDVNVSYFIPYK